MRITILSLRARLLLVALLAVLVPACWSDAADETQDPCAGYGGDDGAGGEGGGGFGGSDVGTGVGGSDVGTGVGVGGSGVGVASSSADVGTGVGAGPSSSDVTVGAGGFSARPVPHHPRRLRRHRRGGLGTAQDAICGQNGNPPPQGGNTISYFRTSQFLPFVTTVPDDGEGQAGGWQQWSGVLTLADGVTDVYSCSVTIGMPLRASAIGMIPQFVAAHYSAEIANEAADGLWPTPYPQGIFCTKFVNQMQTLFKMMLSVLGARVTP